MNYGMQNQPMLSGMGKRKKGEMRPVRRDSVWKELFKNRALYLMILPALVVLILFAYVPMYGIQIAFRNYNAADGITGSPWVGMKNFMFFFNSIYFGRLTFNTLYLNFLFIFFGVAMQVMCAVLINELASRRMQKLYQTAMFFPYFLSWVVVSTLSTAILSDTMGVLNNFIEAMGGKRIIWYKQAKYWPTILTIAHIWKSLGYGMVVYLAKITGIDQEIYEACRIDGANKAQEIFRITLPLLAPTIVLMLLISIGGIFRGNFDMIYSLVNDTGSLLSKTDVIDTYVYRAMRVNGQYGLSAAIGLYQSVMGLLLVLLSNFLVRRYDTDLAMF